MAKIQVQILSDENAHMVDITGSSARHHLGGCSLLSPSVLSCHNTHRYVHPTSSAHQTFALHHSLLRTLEHDHGFLMSHILVWFRFFWEELIYYRMAGYPGELLIRALQELVLPLMVFALMSGVFNLRHSGSG